MLINSRAKRFVPILLGSSLMAFSLLSDSTPTMAAVVPTLTLTANQGIVAHPGSKLVFTATGTNLSGNMEYQFWVENPSGQWAVAQNYSSKSTLDMTSSQTGNYLIEAYALSSQQIVGGDWKAAIASNDGASTGVFVGSTVTTHVSSATLDQGSSVTVSASSSGIFSPMYQFWVEYPDGSWHQSGAYTSQGKYTLTASDTGKYEIVAYAKSPLGLSNPAAALMSTPLYTTASSVLTATTVIASAPTTTPVTGDADNVTLTLRNPDGGVDQSFSGNLALSIKGTDPSMNGSTATLPTTASFKDGVATVPVTLVDSGAEQSLSFAVNGIAQAASINMTPVAGPAAYGLVTNSVTIGGTYLGGPGVPAGEFPASNYAPGPWTTTQTFADPYKEDTSTTFNLSVTLVDQYGNIVTNGPSSVKVTLTDGDGSDSTIAGGSGTSTSQTVSLSNGYGTFTYTTGSQAGSTADSLTVTGSDLKNSSLHVTD